MAEKINKLFGQALDKAVPETWTTLSHDQLMRVRDVFAELMLKECCETVERRYKYSSGTPVSFWEMSQDVQDLLKEHFGVEE